MFRVKGPLSFKDHVGNIRSPFLHPRRWSTAVPERTPVQNLQDAQRFFEEMRIPLGVLPVIQELSFAIVHVGGTQYKLMKGDTVMTQKLEGAEVGKEIILQKVLLIGSKSWTAIGTPLLERARVHAVVEEQTLTKKTIVFKKKRRKNYVRHNTHRQPYTLLRIKDILFDRAGHIDATKGLDADVALGNLTLHPLPPLERVPSPVPILSAANAPKPLPFPSTANPLPEWDKKQQRLKEVKKAQKREKDLKKAEKVVKDS
jgi:large subunit ribosomal protein L21